jgi:hypothetical protein
MVELYKVTKTDVSSIQFFSYWKDRGIVWENIEGGDMFPVKDAHEAMSVYTCFRFFQKNHPEKSKKLRCLRRQQPDGTFNIFFVAKS